MNRKVPPSMGLAMALPRAADDVTVGWLNRVMFEAGVIDSTRIESFEAHPLPGGFGAQCTYARFHLCYARPLPEAPEWVFAKFSRDAPMSKQVCAREVRFYHEIAPSISLRIPRCYFAGHDVTGEQSVVIVEDVSTGTAGDSLAGCSSETAEVFLREIGTFHARWWGDPRLSAWDWIQPSNGPGEIMDRMRQCWPQFKSTFAEALTPASIEAGDLGIKKLPMIWDVITQTPRTLVHGDLQLDNVRLGVADAPFVLFDWQLVRCAQGAGDLAWFLSRSIPIEQRRSDGELLIDLYYQSLLDAAIENYSMEDLRYHLNIRFLFGFFVVATASVGANFSSDRGSRLLRAFVDRNVAAIEDYASWEVLR